MRGVDAPGYGAASRPRFWEAGEAARADGGRRFKDRDMLAIPGPAALDVEVGIPIIHHGEGGEEEGEADTEDEEPQ